MPYSVLPQQDVDGQTLIDTALHVVTGTLGALDAVIEVVPLYENVSSIVFQVSGAWKGKIVVEGAVDGVFNNLSIVQPGGAISFAGVNNDNQNGVYRVLLPTGYTHIHFRMSAYTSGTASLVVNWSSVPVATPFVWQLNAANLNATVVQATGTNLHTVVDSSALPTGASTSANQTNGSQKTQVVASDGTVWPFYSPSTSSSLAGWADKAPRVLIGPTDIISNLPVVIEYDHHQLHEGEVYGWDYANTTGLAAGSSEDIVFTVPNITVAAGQNIVMLAPHLRFEVIADSYSQFFLYEGPTVTGGTGTARTPIPHERNGTYTPKLTILEKPTVTVVGTQLFQGILFSSKTAAGAATSSVNEFVLKNNTKYCFRFTSQTTGCKFLLRFYWYEDLGV